MAVTRAITEQVTVSRCAPTMKRAGMDSTTVNGTNADLNDPIATALEGLGLFAANRAQVGDGDLAQMLMASQPKFLDLVEIRTLETCLGRIATYASGQAWEDYKEDRRTMIKDLTALVEWKWTQYRAKYSSSAPAVCRMRPVVEHQVRDWEYWPGSGRL